MPRQGENFKSPASPYIWGRRNIDRECDLSWILLFGHDTRVRSLTAPRAWSSHSFFIFFIFRFRSRVGYFDKSREPLFGLFFRIPCEPTHRRNFCAMTREGSKYTKKWTDVNMGYLANFRSINLSCCGNCIQLIMSNECISSGT